MLIFLLLALGFSPRAFADCSAAVFFGYIDQHPDNATLDAWLQSRLEQKLTAPCSVGDDLCGFTRTRYDEADFSKGSVALRLRHSSESAIDSVNRAQLSSAQAQKSSLVRADFLRAFSDTKIIFYLGHSRYGYGPDFSPAVLAGGHVNQRAYGASGGASAAEMFRSAGGSAAWRSLDLLSCDSSAHFGDFRPSFVGQNVNYASQVLTPLAAEAQLWQRLGERLRDCE